MKHCHDVQKGSNLDLIIRGTNGAVNKLADAIGGGLRAIALALSTPQDNSAQVQAVINKQVAEIKQVREQLQSEVEENKEKKQDG